MRSAVAHRSQLTADELEGLGETLVGGAQVAGGESQHQPVIEHRV